MTLAELRPMLHEALVSKFPDAQQIYFPEAIISGQIGHPRQGPEGWTDEIEVPVSISYAKIVRIPMQMLKTATFNTPELLARWVNELVSSSLEACNAH